MLAAEDDSDPGPELDRPAANGLVCDVDRSFGDKPLDVAQAHREAEVEPDCMHNDRLREAMTLEGQRYHAEHPSES